MLWTSLRLTVAVIVLTVSLGAAEEVEPPGVGECTSVPMGCFQSGGRLRLDAVRRALSWRWTGRGVNVGDLGNPVLEVGYNVCIYDAAGALVVATGVPASGAWRARSWGFDYRDPNGLVGGLTKIELRAGRRRDRFTVTGQGASLLLPALSAVPPLTVQLVRTDPLGCWSSTSNPR